MRTILEWLCDVEGLAPEPGDALNIRFETPPAPWIMLVGAVLAALVVYGQYRSETVRLRWRWPLMVLRFGVIMTALLLFSRPLLVLHRRHVVPSEVLVVLDRSASMARRDVPASEATREGQAAALESRWSAAARALFSTGSGLIDGLLGQRQRAEVWVFDDSPELFGAVQSAEEAQRMARGIAEHIPVANRTDLFGAVEVLVRKSRGRRIAGIVVVSDGRQNGGTDLETAVSAAREGQIPIHTIALGSTQPPRDVAIASISADEDVFVLDPVAVRVGLELTGYAAGVSMDLELRDKQTGELLAGQTIALPAGQSRWTGELQYRPEAAGEKTLAVTVEPLGDEESVQNNHGETVVRAHEAEISVLYVEDQPRFEYRFLKNFLLREPSIECSCLLLSATPGFAQEGDRSIQQFPQSVESLHRYDVVILGDVDPHEDWLSPAQEAILFDFVAAEGGGLAVLAGPRNLPQSLRGTRLEKLVPVRLAQGPRPAAESFDEPFTPRLTRDGQDHPIFRSRPGPAASEPADLPGWFWTAHVAGAAPAAVVLAEHPELRAEDEPLPIAVLGRFGAGRTCFIGTDDLWRWRADGGLLHYENFWLQVIRTLAMGRRFDGRRSWKLETDRREYDLGSAVHLSAICMNEASDFDTVRALVRNADGDPVRHVQLEPAEGGRDSWKGSFVPAEDGVYTVALEDSQDEPETGAGRKTIRVVSRDPEAYLPQANEETLRALAQATGGSFRAGADDLAGLVRSIPDRSLYVPDEIERPVWDTRLLLGFLVLLIVTEWIVRKGVGLA